MLVHKILLRIKQEGPERFDTINLQAEIKKNIDEIMKATDTGEVTENMDAIKNCLIHLLNNRELEKINYAILKEPLEFDFIKHSIIIQKEYQFKRI